MQIEERAGVLDVVSMAAQRDTCLVLPTLRHALALWPRYWDVMAEVHGKNKVKISKTAVTTLTTRTILRLWVPYSLDPTMPMDWPSLRRDFDFITPYWGLTL